MPVLALDRCIGVEVDFFVFEAAPQPLDEDVVHVAALPVHADHDAVPLQGAGEFVAGELAALIGVEDLGSAIPSQRLLERLDTELGAERAKKSFSTFSYFQLADLPVEDVDPRFREGRL